MAELLRKRLKILPFNSIFISQASFTLMTFIGIDTMSFLIKKKNKIVNVTIKENRLTSVIEYINKCFL